MRIDARTDANRFVAQVCMLTVDPGCTLYSPELERFVPTDAAGLSATLQTSAAWQYALDPSTLRPL